MLWDYPEHAVSFGHHPGHEPVNLVRVVHHAHRVFRPQLLLVLARYVQRAVSIWPPVGQERKLWYTNIITVRCVQHAVSVWPPVGQERKLWYTNIMTVRCVQHAVSVWPPVGQERKLWYTNIMTVRMLVIENNSSKHFYDKSPFSYCKSLNLEWIEGVKSWNTLVSL